MHGITRTFAPGISSRNILLAIATLVLACPAWADVILKEKTVSSGMMGFGNGTSERTTVIAGDRSRTDEQNTYTGRFQTLAGGGKPRASVQITRLDREVFWTLDPDKKQYTELTFADMRQLMESGMGGAQAEAKKPGKDRSQDVQMEYTVDVQRTGKKDRINGFNAEEVIVTLTATPRDAETKESMGAYTMTMDEWLAPAAPGAGEVQAYHRRLAEKLGLDPQMQRMAVGAMAMYGDALKQMAEKLKDLKGYPVRSTLTMGMGGAQTPEQQAQAEKARAKAREAGAEQKKKQHEQEDAAAGQDAAQSVARGNVGGAVGGLLGHRLGRAAQKQAESSAANADAGSTPSGGLTIVTDVLSITTGSAAASYDVPSDYKKVERDKKK
jgi:hypothetical protein